MELWPKIRSKESIFTLLCLIFMQVSSLYSEHYLRLYMINALFDKMLVSKYNNMLLYFM